MRATRKSGIFMGRSPGLFRTLAPIASILGAWAAWAGVAEIGPGDARFADEGGVVVLTVPLTEPVPWSVRIEDGPPRLVVELHDMVWSDTPQLASGSIADVSTGRSGPTSSEMVAYLREPLTITTAEMATSEDGTARLTVWMAATTATGFRDALEAGDAVVTGNRIVVALDPGHGGFDPGARADGHVEADVVLSFAERLREELLSSGRFDVVLTREDDRFVSLDDRISVARAAGADVFLSLHADALEDAGAASGLAVYALDPGAEAEAAERLTERHGPEDVLTGVDLTGAGDDVTLALLELARADTAPRTVALSRNLVAAFAGAGLEVNSQPERSGDFAVLKAADIPSLLVELGFLSTEVDLGRLTSEAWQGQAARAVSDALMLWADEDRLR
jgi:N-acetylmuramoyl-L-alanine amidase